MRLEVTVVRLMNEYSVRWPLWGPEGPLPDGEPTLSPQLSRRLRAWAQNFNHHFSWESGWDSAERGREHAHTAEALTRALEAELGPEVRVDLDLWECP